MSDVQGQPSFQRPTTYASKGVTNVIGDIMEVCGIVETTLGPRGRNVIIQGPPMTAQQTRCTKDGVSVLRSMSHQDMDKWLAQSMIRQAGEDVLNEAGDGTTSVCVFVRALLENLKHITENKRLNAISVQRHLNAYAEQLIAEVGASAVKLETRDDIYEVALVSANGDTRIANAVAHVLWLVTDDGLVNIEQAPGSDITSTVIDGVRFIGGLLDPKFATNPMQGRTHLDAPNYIFLNQEFVDTQSIIEFLKPLFELAGDRQWVLVCPKFNPAILHVIHQCNVQMFSSKSGFILPVKSPGYGLHVSQYMEDVAITCNGTLLSDPSRLFVGRAKNIKLNEIAVGHSDSLTQDIRHTVFTGPKGDPGKYGDRIQMIHSQMEEATIQSDIDRCLSRLAILKSSIGIIKIGANSTVEMGHRQDTVEDSVLASRSAMKGGLVVGGGLAYGAAADEVLLEPSSNLEKNTAREALIFACKEVHAQIHRNAGTEFGAEVLSNLHTVRKVSANFGVSVLEEDTVVNYWDEGIKDPANVIQAVIRSAVTLAGLLISSSSTIIRTNNVSTVG